MKLTSKEYVEILKRNPSLRPTEDYYPNPRELPKLEQDSGSKPVVNKKSKAAGARTLQIQITDVRKRLLDDDNLCEKWIVDCLRRDGTIVDDSTKFVRIFTTQRKCEKGEEPHTLIEIY